MSYKPTIGLEIHAILNTRIKMFCDSANNPSEIKPNVNICPVCSGQPGSLPVINKEAVKKVILTGFALNCDIAERALFERKNYFYPDLPKGYQISQYQTPFCENGHLDIMAETGEQGVSSKKIRIRRIHLEEDAGKLLHDPEGKYSLVDFNRAGAPLMELVTEPDFESGTEVKKFAEELQLIFRYLEISDADMEKGQLRVEVNISVKRRPKNVDRKTENRKEEPLGTKVEIKNLNSIRAAADSVDYEIKRQTELLKSDRRVTQETRGWDDKKKKTFSQRIKEEEQDYRYFPEPDLPPMVFAKTKESGQSANEIFLDKIKAGLPELPEQRRVRFSKQYGINAEQIEIFTQNKMLGDYYEKVVTEIDSMVKAGNFKLYFMAANYIITEFPPILSASGKDMDEVEGIKVLPEFFAELAVMISDGRLSSSSAKIALKEMARTGSRPEQIVKEKNLGQISDISEIESTVKEMIIENPRPAEDYRRGKKESLQFLVGQVMKKTKGKANPVIVKNILEKKLK